MGRSEVKMRLPPYVQAFTDRHGGARYYFRKPGFKRVALPGLPYSPEFMAAHSEAMAGQVPASELGASRTAPGTIAALTVTLFNSAAWSELAPTTRTTYRGIIERFRAEHGDKRVALLKREHIVLILAKKAKTRAAANNFLKMVRMLMQLAIVEGLRKDDPTSTIKSLKNKSDGFHTWTEDEIAAFEAKHPLGTRARLAMDLLLYTAQRRGDVVTMGRQHVRDGVLRLRQQKTGMVIEIPVLPVLQASLCAGPTGDLTFLVTQQGRAFTAAGFGGWFHQVCKDAGLENCSAHGLRKAASRRLAEAGCTAHQIMAWTGHKTLKEVTRYTAAADRSELAIVAANKLATGSVKPRRSV
jgi:integrase